LNVVVNERRVVKKLDRDRPIDGTLWRSAESPARAKSEPRTNTLTARLQVIADHACTRIGESVTG
jgi:hypothetical protein